MSLNTKTILQLIVPEYTITLVTFLAIFLLTFKQTSSLPLLVVPFVIYLIALFGFNVINQVFDVKMDALTKPSRPIPSKKVTIKEATLFAELLFGVSLILAFFSQLLLPLGLFLIATLLYSHPKIFLRRYLLATPIFGLIFYAVIPFIFVSSYLDIKINFFTMAFFSLLIAGVSSLKDMEDVFAEKKFGLKSIPGLFGNYATTQLSIFSLLSTITVFGIVFISNNVLFILPVIISLAVVLATGLILNKLRIEKKLNYSKVLPIFMLIVVFIQLLFGISAFLI